MRLHQDFDKFFTPHLVSSTSVPKMELFETETSYHLVFDVPGVKKDDMTIEVEDQILVLKGERKSKREEANFSEIQYGSFERRLKLPRGLDLDNIKAHMENGQLSLSVAKVKDASKKKIEIHA